MAKPRLEKLLRPQSIAVIGASTREISFGFRALRNLKTYGYGGPIYPVNPHYDEILGYKCYPTLDAVPGPVDAAFVALAAERGPEVLEDCGRKGVGGAAVVASGFADAGAEGAKLQARIVEIAARHGIALNGPNNLGAINLFDRATLWPSTLLPGIEAGPIALVTQSGSVGIATSQDERRLGIGYTITAGNEAVLSVADYVDFLAGEERIKVIMLFLEAIRRPAAFAAAVRKARRRGQAVIALKVGTSESGARAVQAHTGALAGDDAVYDAFFRAHGVVRVGDLDEMQETAALLAAHPAPPPVRDTAVVTLSGGQAALFADLAARFGVSGRELSPATIAKLREVLPPYANPRNPLDAFGAGWNPEVFDRIIDILTKDRKVGVVAFSMDAPGSGGADSNWVGQMAEMCAARLPQRRKRYVFVNNMAAGGLNPHVREKLDRHGLPYLLGMRAGAAAIGRWLNMPKPRPKPETSPKEWARKLCAEALAARTDPERLDVLAKRLMPLIAARAVTNRKEAAETAEMFGYPVALKGCAEGVLHKTEEGLVRIGLADRKALNAAYDAIAKRLKGRPDACVYLQPMTGPGLELVLGGRTVPGFGPVVVVGLGGTLVEVAREASLRLAPVDEAEARAMLSETRAGELLAGTRGRGPYDIEAAVEAVEVFSQFVAATSDALAAVEVNPLIVLEEGMGAFGVDVVFELHRKEGEA